MENQTKATVSEYTDMTSNQWTLVSQASLSNNILLKTYSMDVGSGQLFLILTYKIPAISTYTLIGSTVTFVPGKKTDG